MNDHCNLSFLGYFGHEGKKKNDRLGLLVLFSGLVWRKRIRPLMVSMGSGKTCGSFHKLLMDWV
jgi:hypothetical protein